MTEKQAIIEGMKRTPHFLKILFKNQKEPHFFQVSKADADRFSSCLLEYDDMSITKYVVFDTTLDDDGCIPRQFLSFTDEDGEELIFNIHELQFIDSPKIDVKEGFDIIEQQVDNIDKKNRLPDKSADLLNTGSDLPGTSFDLPDTNTDLPDSDDDEIPF